MKHLLKPIALLVAAITLPAQGLEPRTFYDSGKTKSFQATLSDYDAKTKTVTVIAGRSKTMKFPLSVLAEDCQKYVLSKKDLLTVAKNVRLKFTEVKETPGAESSNVHFDIEVYNRGKNSIEDVTLRYTIYYDEGDLKRGGFTRRTSEGILSTGKMFDGDTLTVATSPVYLVRAITKPSGGG